MKKALFALSALMFAYAQGYVTTVGGEDVRVSCTIITDIAVVSKDGIPYFPKGDWGDGDAPMDRIIEANGYAFLTTRFADVEEAALKWGKTAESMWNVYSQNLNTLIDPEAKRLTASNLGAVAYAMSYNNNAIQRKFGVKLSLIAEAIENMQTDDNKETTEKYDKVSSAQSELSNRLKLISNQYDARLKDAVNEAKQASASVVSIQTQLADVQRRMNELSETKPPDYSEQFARLQAEFNAKLEQSAQASLVAGLTKVAENHVRQLLAMSIPSGFPIPAQVTTYSNQMARLNTYLGYEGETQGGSITNLNDGTFKEPEVDGRKVANIIEYMNANGVLGYSSDAGNPTNARFSVAFEVHNDGGSQSVHAPFTAPTNWVDGTTVIWDNGVYKVFPKNAWSYFNGSFHNARVIVGSNVITPTGLEVSAAGNYYCHVYYSSSGEYTATVSQSNSGGDWVWLVATLAIDSETGECYSTYEIGTTPVILCYE